MSAFLGTPFNANDSNDRHKFVPVWKQTAIDDQGRKKFHGAFTGGFVAGYHNTVGSKEGFSPATFTSSKSQKKGKLSHSVEDYMDEEDLKAMQREMKLYTTETFSEGKVQSRKDGLGWKILRRMGWDGQITKVSPVFELLRTFRKTLRNKDQEAPPKSLSDGFGLSVLEDEEDIDIYNPTVAGLTGKLPIKPFNSGEKKVFERDSKGTNMEGFVLASRPLSPQLNYPPPIVPPSFKPCGLGLSSNDEPLPIVKSFDQVDNAPLNDNPVMKSLLNKETFEIDVTTALAAQRGYMPFQMDPAKDVRYHQFLAHFANRQTSRLPEKPSGMTPSDFERELFEFSKAAKLYRPLPSSMASKFVTSKKAVFADNMIEKGGLYKPVLKPESDQNIKNEPEVPKNVLNNGVITRSEEKWAPSSLLCNLLNITPPPDTTENAKTMGTNPILGFTKVQDIIKDTPYAEKIDLSSLVVRGEDGDFEDPVDVIIPDLQGRPPIEFFKSIFEPEPSMTPPFVDTDVISTKVKKVYGPTMPLSTDQGGEAKYGTQESQINEETDCTDKGNSDSQPITQESLNIISKPKPINVPLNRVEEDLGPKVQIAQIKKRRPAASDLW